MRQLHGHSEPSRRGYHVISIEEAEAVNDLQPMVTVLIDPRFGDDVRIVRFDGDEVVLETLRGQSRPNASKDDVAIWDRISGGEPESVTGLNVNMVA
jgi:hypothetical protein